MKNGQVMKTMVRIAVVDSDPLRFVGFRALLSPQADFDLQSVSLAEIGTHQGADMVLLGSHPGKNVVDVGGAAGHSTGHARRVPGGPVRPVHAKRPPSRDHGPAPSVGRTRVLTAGRS